MKTNAKLFLLFFVLSGIFISCSSDDDSGNIPEEPSEVGLKSFGFYKAENNELIKDYEIEDISGTEISISLPSEIDRSNLVARFTTTENDEVTVQGTTQVSGETGNDFSNPLEYMLKEGETNKIYTVTVGKLAEAVWSKLPVFTADEMREFSMSINPTNSAPSIAYISNPEDSDNRKANLITFENDDWNRTGGSNFSPKAKNVDLAYNQKGVPFVAFADNDVDPLGISLMSYESSSWNYVGGAGFSGTKASTSAISVDDEGDIFGFYINDARGEDRRGVFSKKFDGSGWSDLPISGRDGAARVIKSKAINGAVYLAVLDFGNLQSISVYKYKDGNWTTLADKMKASEDNAIYYYNVSIDVDSEENVFVAYAENDGSGTDYQLKVKKYTADDNSWSTVGNMIATSELRSFDIAVDAYQSPVFFYKNDGENPVVLKFDNDTNNWGAAIELDNAEADDLKIEFAPNGVGYASYLVGNQVYVQKYASPDNE